MIGREAEIGQLRDAQNSEYSEFVAVYGRRRIGKTFLINETFNYKFAFHAAGVEGASRRVQLDQFRLSLKRQGRIECPRLNSWAEAFYELELLLDGMGSGKKVVFLDELPWFDTQRSGFLAAFENFWNEWATSRKDILLIICGSATTWIINKVLRNRGGLYNRVTKRIALKPFTLSECEKYAAYKQLNFDRRQLCECYMAFGGVAYYWSLLQEGQSAAQNFDRLFFGETHEMRDEFRCLFSSMFKMSTLHMEIVRIIGHSDGGMTRADIIEKLKNKVSGGDLREALEELVECGFLNGYNEIGKAKKGIVYHLVDAYVLFYFRFLEGYHGRNEHYWSQNYRSPAFNTWRGLAFERLCMAHVSQIKSALGISGIASEVYSWRSHGSNDDERGVQIDMLIDRSDDTVDLCEMKYCAEEYELKSSEADRLAHRAEVFRRVVAPAKSVRIVMVTTYGVKHGKHSGVFQGEVVLNDLFK